MQPSNGSSGAPLNAAVLGLCHLHPRAYMATVADIPGLRVTAAAERDPAVRTAFERDYGVRTYEDWAALIDTEKLDLALIFLPHVECPAAAATAAARGIHVVVEKPMAADAAGARRIIEAARKTGVLLTTPYVWRYHPVALEMKRYASDGTLGQIVGCEGRCAAGRLNRYLEGNAGWMLDRSRSGGGPMYNLGVHWIDFYRWLLDDEVAEAAGTNVHVNKDYDIEDNSFAILTFRRGTVLALDISYTVPESYPFGRDLYLALRGTAGVLSWSPSFEGIKERLFVCSDAPGFAAAPRRHIDFELEPRAGYAGIMGHRFLSDVVDAIRNRRKPAIGGADGLRALEVVEAIYQSAETGKTAKVKHATDLTD